MFSLCIDAVIDRSDRELFRLTPPKVNRLGLNLEHCEHIVGAVPGTFLARSAQWRQFERQAFSITITAL